MNESIDVLAHVRRLASRKCQVVAVEYNGPKIFVSFGDKGEYYDVHELSKRYTNWPSLADKQTVDELRWARLPVAADDENEKGLYYAPTK